MYSKKEREQYNEYRQRICEKLNITKNQYNWLRRKGNELRNIYTDACNGDIDYDGEYEALTEPIYEQIKNDKYLKEKKFYYYYQTDPRGATIYVDRQPIPDNNYTKACCIY